MMADCGDEVVLGYYQIRGLGSFVRLALAEAGVKYTEKRYGRGIPWATGDRNTLGLALPNLPYLIHDDVQISEMQSILRYIAETWADRLLGGSRRERALQDNVLTYIISCNNNLRAWAYGYLPQTNTITGKQRGMTGFLSINGVDSPDAQSHMRAVAMEQVRELLSPKTLTNLQGIPADAPHTGPFIFGPLPTLADLALYEHAGLCRCINAEMFDQVPGLSEHCAAVEALPRVAALLASDTWVHVPFNAPFVRYEYSACIAILL